MGRQNNQVIAFLTINGEEVGQLAVLILLPARTAKNQWMLCGVGEGGRKRHQKKSDFLFPLFQINSSKHLDENCIFFCFWKEKQKREEPLIYGAQLMNLHNRALQGMSSTNDEKTNYSFCITSSSSQLIIHQQNRAHIKRKCRMYKYQPTISRPKAQKAQAQVV